MTNKVLMKFSGDFCPPCKVLQSVMDAMEAEGKLLVDEIQYFNVDECFEVFKEFGVRNVPTLILMNDGKEIRRSVGVMTTAQLERFVEL